MNLLQLQNGFKQYGQKILFQGASLAVNAGEHVGVIGPNGAGKTTLFKILVEQESLSVDADIQMKFHSLPLLKVIELENQTGQTTC